MDDPTNATTRLVTPMTAATPGNNAASKPTGHAGSVIAAVEHWLEKAVIGLNLCPFARAVHRKNQIRYVVSEATDREALALDLAQELALLHESDPQKLETTLLIHPRVLIDFFDYNAFLPLADRVVQRLGLTGHVQLASFHPGYEFADCPADAVDNYTNRSPYPMLHLLRETSIERAIEAFPDADAIYQRNIDTMRTLGVDGWRALGLYTPPHPEKNSI